MTVTQSLVAGALRMPYLPGAPTVLSLIKMKMEVWGCGSVVGGMAA